MSRNEHFIPKHWDWVNNNYLTSVRELISTAIDESGDAFAISDAQFADSRSLTKFFVNNIIKESCKSVDEISNFLPAPYLTSALIALSVLLIAISLLLEN